MSPNRPPGASDLPFSSAPARDAGEELEVGTVSGVFGVQGEVRLHLHHRESALLDGGLDVVLVDPTGARFSAHVTSRSGAGRRVIGRFRQRITREQAAGLKGWAIRVAVASLPSLDEGEFWVWQVLGAPVYVGDAAVGKVVEVHHTGPVDVFEVSVVGTSDPVFVPALGDNVVSVGPDGLVLRSLE